jgi:hypothetical protein
MIQMTDAITGEYAINVECDGYQDNSQGKLGQVFVIERDYQSADKNDKRGGKGGEDGQDFLDLFFPFVPDRHINKEWDDDHLTFQGDERAGVKVSEDAADYHPNGKIFCIKVTPASKALRPLIIGAPELILKLRIDF